VNLERLRGIAREELDRAIATLRETGSVMQMFTLVKRDESVEMIALDGALTNNEGFKADLSRKIKARIAAGELQAVMMVSDTYFAANITPENQAIRQRLRLTIEEAHAFGLCELREGVMVVLESPIFAAHMRQEYRRVDGGKRVELVGEPWIASDADGTMQRMTARFSGYWSAPR
jgi:hypothetical protein